MSLYWVTVSLAIFLLYLMKTRQPFAYIDDPFSDPPGLTKPPSSPTRVHLDNSTRIAEDEDPLVTLPE